MQLSDEQKQTLTQWVKEGLGLSDIQRRFSQDFKVSITYMDLRFLMLDLGLQVQDKAAATPPRAATPAAAPGQPVGDEPDADDLMPEPPASGGLGGVSIEVDRVMKPGSLVSGSVTFSDGVSGSWSLDQFGRLALSTGQPGYKPSQQDIQLFQEQLRSALERKGF